MAKYSHEFKKKIVQEYLNGNAGSASRIFEGVEDRIGDGPRGDAGPVQ